MENNSILCDDITDFCVDSFKYGVFFSFNIFSVLFNIFNLVALKKLDKSKRNAYFWILVNIGICDILTCFAFSLAVSCELNRLIVTLPALGQNFQLAATILLVSSFFARIYILAIGSYERYMSVCHPFSVNSNKLVNNIKVCLCIVWITGVILMTSVTLSNTEEYCFGEFGAIPAKLNKQTSIVFGISVTTAFISSAIYSSKTWKELKRMQSRNTVPAQDDLVAKRSAQYIIIASAALYLSYIQTVISAVFNGVGDVPIYLKYLVKWIFFFYMTFYSILNIVLYFLMIPGYRIHVLKLLKLKNPAVRPI